jgi:flagellar protein FlaG
MDINSLSPMTPVSSGLASTSNRNPSGTAAPSSAVVSLPIVGDGGKAATAPAPVGPSQQAGAQSQYDPKQVLEAVAKQLQQFLQSSQRAVEFRVDADTGAQVITVRDANTGEIIRQMPSEEVLRVMRNLYDAQGSLLNTKV